MIEFSCPSCGKALSGNDEFAGRVMKCPSCQQPLTVPSAPKSQAPSTIITTYDRFKDLTRVSTPAQPNGFDGVWVTAHARFKGKDLSKAVPVYALWVEVWTKGRLNELFSGNELILLADGARISLELLGPGEPTMLAVIDEMALHAVAAAKEIDGQIDGQYEFKLTPAQIALIADFYRQITQRDVGRDSLPEAAPPPGPAR
jgi:hypothetical protein